jgi:membrane-associated phospholipid phosphatase
VHEGTLRATGRGRWPGVLTALVLVALPVAGGAATSYPPAAQDAGPAAPAGGPAAAPEASPPRRADDGRRTTRRFPANLWRGARGMFSSDNLVPLAAGGAATGLSAFFDDDVRSAVADPGNSLGRNLSSVGALPAVGIVTGLFVGGRFAHEQRFRAATYDLLDAMIVNAAYTQVLKFATQRERPDGSNKHSFPSGHSSDAFALATVVERHYGWKLGVPSYVLAGAIGYSRIMQDKHWLSDVVAGATLGYVVGHTVVRVNGRPLDVEAKKTTWNLSPVVSRSSRGLLLAVSF